MSARPPPMTGVLETVLYFSDEAATERFYSDVLGMRLVGHEPGRSFFYRAGASVFLLFSAEAARRGGKLPPHGADGCVHTCFRVPSDTYQRWREHLIDSGVEVLRDVDWGSGKTFYFHDPSGNLLEIANADIWPA